MIRVVIVDDDLFVRTTLASLLGASGEVEVVATYADGTAAAAAVVQDAPDVALVDIVMPEADGPRTVRLVRQAAPAVRVLALTSLADPRAAASMLEAGAIGFLPKDLPVPAMVHSIQAAAFGVSVLAGGGAGLLSGVMASAEPPELSQTQRRILELVVAGRTNNEIAALVYLSPSTVKHQVSDLMVALGATNRVTLALRAHELGLG